MGHCFCGERERQHKNWWKILNALKIIYRERAIDMADASHSGRASFWRPCKPRVWLKRLILSPQKNSTLIPFLPFLFSLFPPFSPPVCLLCLCFFTSSRLKCNQVVMHCAYIYIYTHTHMGTLPEFSYLFCPNPSTHGVLLKKGKIWCKKLQRAPRESVNFM